MVFHQTVLGQTPNPLALVPIADHTDVLVTDGLGTMQHQPSQLVARLQLGAADVTKELKFLLKA